VIGLLVWLLLPVWSITFPVFIPPFLKARRQGRFSISDIKMNRQQELLSEAVRQYEHLYNPSLVGYKDTQKCSNSWDEIASNMGMPVGVCVNKWKSIRDKYVREKKAMQSRSGDAGGKGVSPWFISLSWLGVHIKHRATCSNYDKVNMKVLLF
jgi:hypothetical protein